MATCRFSAPIIYSGDRWIVGDLQSEADVRAAFEALADAYGFARFLVLDISVRSATSLGKSVMMTNWPADLLTAYDSAGMIVGSPVFEQLRRSTVPFAFDTKRDSIRRANAKSVAVHSLLLEARIERGIYIPVHHTSGRRGAVGFGGDRASVRPNETSALTFVASHLFNRLIEIRAVERNPHDPLSRREIDCLRLAAAGKTTVEMAKILRLSEYTVNHYLNRATRKLDSVNRVQTVAKAIRAGLII